MEARLSSGEAPRGDDDPGLIQAFLDSRDEQAFRDLFRRHSPALYCLALRLLGGDAANAEDAVQEAWIRAAERLSSFRFESTLRTWLCGFVVNCCREARRRPVAVPVAADEPPPPGGVEPHTALDLERALLGLADGYRQVLVLHDVVGFTHREIAARLGIEEGTSKSQLSLARRALRRRLGAGSEDRHG